MLTASRVLVGCICALGIAGCSLAVDADRKQCSSDNDCAGHGFANSRCDTTAGLCQALTVDEPDTGAPPMEDPRANDPNWGCLFKPKEVRTEAGPFKVNFQTTNIVKPMMPPVGAKALLCLKLDPTCDSPIGDPQVTDEMGNLTLTVNKGFSGIVEFTHPEFLPGVYGFNPALDRDLEMVPIQLASPTVAGLLTNLVHTPYSMDRGLMLVRVANCNGVLAPGITLKRDGAPIPVKECPPDLICETPFYAINGAPNGDAVETDTSGYSGFINVPPGSAVVTATIRETNVKIQTASFIVRAGAITYAQMVPIGK